MKLTTYAIVIAGLVLGSCAPHANELETLKNKNAELTQQIGEKELELNRVKAELATLKSASKSEPVKVEKTDKGDQDLLARLESNRTVVNEMRKFAILKVDRLAKSKAASCKAELKTLSTELKGLEFKFK